MQLSAVPHLALMVLLMACSPLAVYSQPAKPPVILIYAKNIEPHATSVFFQSAQRYVPQARIVLFTNAGNTEAARYHGVQVITDSYGMNSSIVNNCTTGGACQALDLVPHLHRLVVVAKYLEQHADEYSVALACDARDVVFQDNLFAMPAALELVQAAKVLVTTEDPPPGYEGANRLTVVQQGWNARWIRSCWGEDVLQQHFKDKSIINSGFLLANPKALLLFAQDIMKTFFDACPIDVFQPGLDQGVVTYLAHVGLAKVTAPQYHVQVMPNGQVVFQAGLTILQTRILVDRFMRIVSADGKPFPVVHQFDRVPVYAKLMQQRYAYEALNMTGISGGKMELAPQHVPAAGTTS